MRRVIGKGGKTLAIMGSQTGFGSLHAFALAEGMQSDQYVLYFLRLFAPGFES